MTDEQTRLNNGFDSLLESLAKLQIRVEQLSETVNRHEEIFHVARDCAQRQQGAIETMGTGFADIVGKLRTLDSNDSTIQTELLQQRGELALLAGAVSVVIPHRDLN